MADMRQKDDLMDEIKLKQDICEVGRRLYQRGLVAANDGNISIRVSENEILATPTGVSKGFMTPDMIIKVDLDGNLISGRLLPSSEIRMHLAVYRERPDAGAVVHAHPPTATGFAVAGIPLDKFTLPEVVINLGKIPLASYATPSTDEVPESIRPHILGSNAILLANHGAITVGRDVYDALFKMESLELFAQVTLTARRLGNENEFSQEDLRKLMKVKEKLGIA